MIQRQTVLDQAPKTWTEFFARAIDWRGFYWHLAVAWVFLLFAWRRIKSGAWIPLARSLAGIFTRETKVLHYLAQAGLLYVGAVEWGGSWNWLWGAAAAMPVGLLSAILMLFFGFFDRPALAGPAVGDINPPPRSQRPPPRQPGRESDKDRGDSW